MHFKNLEMTSESDNEAPAASSTNSSVCPQARTRDVKPPAAAIYSYTAAIWWRKDDAVITATTLFFKFRFFLFLMTVAQFQSTNERKKRVKRHFNKNSTVGMTPDPRLRSKYEWRFIEVVLFTEVSPQ